MSRNLRARVERLERQHGATGKLPPLFWQALCGAVPLDQLDPETRRLVEPLFSGGRQAPDVVEEKIEQALPSRLPGIDFGRNDSKQ